MTQISHTASQTWEQKFNPKWIQDGLSEAAIDYLLDFSKEILKITKTQVRNFYGDVKRIQGQGADKTSVLRLRAKLAYLRGKRSNSGTGHQGRDKRREREDQEWIDFHAVIDKALRAIQADRSDTLVARFETFVAVLESILAFHRFHGGKD